MLYIMLYYSCFYMIYPYVINGTIYMIKCVQIHYLI